jgi:Flp pilus assembly protein TadG
MIPIRTRNNRHTPPNRSNENRRGVTLVEFALVSPALFLFIFACFEFAQASMIRNSVGNAAYEGARRIVVPGSTAAQGITAAQSVLANSGVTNSTVTVNPATLTDSTSDVTVTVSVSFANNSWTTPWFLGSATMTRSCTLVRETKR